MRQMGEGAVFGGSLWLLCVHNIPSLASPGLDLRLSAPVCRPYLWSECGYLSLC